MATAERDLLYRAKFVDDVSSGVTSMTAAWDRGFDAMTRAVRDGNAELVKIQSQLGKTREAGATAGASMAQGMSSALPSVRGVTDALGAQVAQLRAQAAAMKTPEHQAYARAQQALRTEIEALTRAASHQGAAVQGVSSSLGAAQAPTRSLSASWADLAGKWFLASQAISLVGGAVSRLSEHSSKWQMMRNSITDTEGGAEKAASTISTLIDAAKLPGLDLEPLSRGYVGFRSLNIEGEKAVRTMKAFGNAIALAGGGANEFERVNRQLLQMLGKGRVLQEDMSIIAESMPRIRELTKSAFGTFDIEKIRESGVTAEEFVDGIVSAAERLPAASNSIKNSLDNAGTATSIFLDKLMPDKGVELALSYWETQMTVFSSMFDAVASPIETATLLFQTFKNTVGGGLGSLGKGVAGFLGYDIKASLRDRQSAYGINGDAGSANSSQALASGDAYQAYMDGIAKKSKKLWEAQDVVLANAKKVTAKSDLATALEIEDAKWKGQIAIFQEGSAGYAKVHDAWMRERAAIQKRFAPKGGESEAKRMARHSLASDANVIKNADGSVTMREDPGADAKSGHAQNIAKAERAEDKWWADKLKKRADLNSKIINQERKVASARAKILAAEAKAEQETLDKKKEGWREYGEFTRGIVASNLKTALKGDWTLKESASALKDSLIDFAVEQSTKRIAAAVEEMVFGEAQRAVATKAAAATTAAQIAEMTAIASAAAPAAAGVSLATAGANSVAASAGIAQTYALTSMLSTVARARGGPSFGDRIVGERGPERERPIVPTIITPAHKTTTTTNQTVHYHFHGYGERDIQRITRRASVNGAGTSR